MAEAFVADSETRILIGQSVQQEIKLWKHRGLSPKAASSVSKRAAGRAGPKLGAQAAADLAAGNRSSDAIQSVNAIARSYIKGNWLAPKQYARLLVQLYALPLPVIQAFFDRPDTSELVRRAGWHDLGQAAALFLLGILVAALAAGSPVAAAAFGIIAIGLFAAYQGAVCLIRPAEATSGVQPAPTAANGPAPAARGPERRLCSRCGSILEPGDAFCINCGAPVS